MKKPMRILAIETSCDETAVAVLEVLLDQSPPPPLSRGSSSSPLIKGVRGISVPLSLVSSQIPVHIKYGGVVPEVAARSHVPETVSLITQALEKYPLKELDAIAVTRGPGLATALNVGIEAARTLAAFSGKPLVGVNHLEGHIASAWLNEDNRKRWEYPLLVLIVSGGHTELVLMRDFCRYKIVGRTRDDAAGEAFDKSAKLMGLAYPGGPKIAALAEQGRSSTFKLPRPMLHDGSLDFSFSGLKTAVRQLWESLGKQDHVSSITYQVSSIRNGPILDTRYPIPDTLIADLAASLQAAIVEVLVEKTMAAAKEHRIKGVAVVGGVSANTALRQTLEARFAKDLPNVAFLPSDRAYVTDNAAMIAAAGYWRFQKGDTIDWRRIDVRPEWPLCHPDRNIQKNKK